MSINKRNRTRPIVVFSVEKTECNKEVNAGFTADVQAYMDDRGISYRKCIGSYKGQLETSFVITEKSFHELKDLIFDTYEQESVLHVDEDDKASLVFNPNLGEFDEMLGKLEKTGIHNAINNKEAFTIAGNVAYVVE